MYITEIAIEGFKSYATRVVLPNFDPTFNAITGLNGTGKSNILDSICFVLGIKNLSQVRATSLQELVYKQGQAGVTKATVSITFHNNDPRTGPQGYDDKEYITVTRSIVIGGRNKYTINGHITQENRVTDFFHSVQLNVNNPHFLIMQGRINKVCSMKPPEIMSLLEEASGTRMYEKKKEKAMQTMQKKDQKLAEIDVVLKQDIQPAVEKLKKQCTEYNEWTDLTSKRERLKRFLVANDYTECRKVIGNARTEVAALEAAVAERQELKGRKTAELAEKQSQIKDLQTEKEIQAGGEIRELQQAVDKLNMKLTKDTTNCKNKKETLDAEKKELKKLEAAVKEMEEADLQGKVAAARKARDEAAEGVEKADRAVEAAGREVAGAEAGDGRDESNRSLQERLADAQNAQTSANAEAQQADIRAKHLSQQLADTRRSAAAKDKEAGTLQRDLAKHKETVEECTRLLQGQSFDEAELRRLEAERERLGPAIRACQEEVERLGHQVAGCGFSYSNPRPGFDRSKVHGVLARLVHVKDPATSTALEVAAGGKLYQVVVDDEVTAKQLLEGGKLVKRVTIIPLNKVQFHTMPNSVIDAARRLGGNKVQPALELVGCQEQVQRAVKYAFGAALVCQDSGTAKKLAFAREVNHRCITLQGDDFNPAGLLTGGSRTQQANVLGSLHELAAAEAKLQALKAELREVEQKLAGMSGAVKEHKRLTQQLELKRHALGLLQERIAGSESAQLAAAADQLEAQATEAQAQAQAARARLGEMQALAKSLEKEIKNFSQERGKRLQVAQDKLKRAKAEQVAARKLLKQCEQALQEAIAEADSADKEGGEVRRKVSEAAAAVAALQTELQALNAEADKARAAFEAASVELEARRERLRECDSEIAGFESERQGLQRAVQEIEVEVKRTENKIKAKNEEVKKYVEHIAKLEEQYKWVLAERDGFGSGDYDFKAHDPAKVHAQYSSTEKRLEELKGKINHQCLAKLEKAESECKGLMDKYTIVENDKKSLMQVMEELDEKKKAALKATWIKVNQDFGAIFSTLLPGTQAKLEPPEGQSFLDGLDMRVAFGDVWKESLTELSGGQRSLLALSLILALCRFKPAPLYILDEVDSALDLNNSQNIGRMIKQHFPQSQFIVVSHKDGFFNNANIIFRTKFVDGVSAVTRTVVQHADRVASGAVTDKEAGGKQGAGAGGRGRGALKEANR